jgi:PAS domain S-box-containing protein
MTGYGRLELIGRHAGVLYREAENPQTSGNIRDALQREGLWRGETAFRHRDGHLVPSIVAISRLGTGGVGQPGGMVAVISDISALKAAQAQLHDLAYRDNLTGLPNFRALTQALQARLAAPEAHARPFLVMFFDLDHLQGCLPPGHLLCRRSGDEFVAIVEGVGSMAEAGPALEPLPGRSSCHFEAQTPRGPLPVSVSAGVARFPQDGLTMQDLLIRADGALLQVKQDGRGSVRWAQPGQDDAAGPGLSAPPG